MRILITGAAGYIGSHTMVDLINRGHNVVGFDNYKNGDRKIAEKIKQITGHNVKCYNIDLNYEAKLDSLLKHNKFDAVIHFAALKSVPESFKKPNSYYYNNVVGTSNLVMSCLRNGIEHIVLSSSCSVYGDTDSPVTETFEIPSILKSPYANTKKIQESLVKYMYQYTIFRYFNPGGSHESLIIGDNSDEGVLNNMFKGDFKIFGNDYPTKDGTCIRDYIHVMDIAKAHSLAIEQKAYGTFNLGTGIGTSVKELADIYSTLDDNFSYSYEKRRDGDIVSIFADYSKAKRILGWEPTYNLKDIVESSYKFRLAKNK